MQRTVGVWVVHVCMHAYTHIHINMHVYTQLLRRACPVANICVCVCIHTFFLTCEYTRICCMYFYVCICVYVYVYMHVCTIHTWPAAMIGWIRSENNGYYYTNVIILTHLCRAMRHTCPGDMIDLIRSLEGRLKKSMCLLTHTHTTIVVVSETDTYLSRGYDRLDQNAWRAIEIEVLSIDDDLDRPNKAGAALLCLYMYGIYVWCIWYVCTHIYDRGVCCMFVCVCMRLIFIWTIVSQVPRLLLCLHR
jgi:hypothetical protein